MRRAILYSLPHEYKYRNTRSLNSSQVADNASDIIDQYDPFKDKVRKFKVRERSNSVDNEHVKLKQVHYKMGFGIQFIEDTYPSSYVRKIGNKR